MVHVDTTFLIGAISLVTSIFTLVGVVYNVTKTSEVHILVNSERERMKVEIRQVDEQLAAVNAQVSALQVALTTSQTALATSQTALATSQTALGVSNKVTSALVNEISGKQRRPASQPAARPRVEPNVEPNVESEVEPEVTGIIIRPPPPNP